MNRLAIPVVVCSLALLVVRRKVGMPRDFVLVFKNVQNLLGLVVRLLQMSFKYMRCLAVIICLSLLRSRANFSHSSGVSIDLACASAVFFFLIFLSASKSIQGGEYPALMVILGMCLLIIIC